MATNTVSFPSEHEYTIPTASTVSSAETRHSALSISRHATALEICDLVYSASEPSWEAIERFYEPNAIYENPVVTATSRAVIADIHTVAGQLAEIDIPRPLAVLYALFGVKREPGGFDPLFRLLRAWSETGDVCESESFDGHRKVIVEHTLHIVLLPGMHSSLSQQGGLTPSFSSNISDRSISFPSSTRVLQQIGQRTTLGLNLSLPSPLHLRLPIVSRLSFNDAGKITYHRDFWDVKDLLGLIPGMSLAQWISGRLMAQGIRGLTWIGHLLYGTPPDTPPSPPHLKRRNKDEEAGLAAALARAVEEGAVGDVYSSPTQ